jgi:heme-degrading monooxygenase HmoA
MIITAPLKHGAARDWDGPITVSVTDFRTFRLRDLPRVWRTGLRLRRAWPHIPGAVGLYLWADIPHKRSGSVSIWKTEDDLRAFVRWAPHVEIMRRNRDSGHLLSETWSADQFDPAIWRTARRRLTDRA